MNTRIYNFEDFKKHFEQVSQKLQNEQPEAEQPTEENSHEKIEEPEEEKEPYVDSKLTKNSLI